MAYDKNRLQQESSPYLLQHADNPVHWHAWGEEAFKKAKEQDKPVFLSIGYATCHWCHVMAHESFEDEGIAEMMNEVFINIKVDREERPDIDNTYMTVCQMLTGHGGWPLTIIMTPEKKPFYAATYIPKHGRHGRAGMWELIPWINGLWDDKREKIYNSAEEIIKAFRESGRNKPGDGLTEKNLQKTYRQFEQQFDDRHGGFGSAPKFPSPHNLMFLLRYGKRSEDEKCLSMVLKTLIEMRRGGIYDHIGLGFHRYSTDGAWLVPHFEKMLYDQAMLAMAYTEAWQSSRDPLFRQTAKEILAYVTRDLRDKKGAFYSAEDADSEGVEGKFYVWSVDEIRDSLPPEDAELAIEVFNLRKRGNYEDEASGRLTGKNIPHLTRPLSSLAKERSISEAKLRKKIASIRKQLFEVREQRQRPLLDDKVLTDWNGLMIAALSKAGRVFGLKKFIKKAEQAARFVLKQMLTKNGSLLHRYRNGDVAIPGHADDYAFLIWGLIELYETTFKAEYLQTALDLNATFIENFWDEDEGAFYFTGEGSEELLGRKKEFYDGAIPSGNSVAMMNLLRLGRLTANTDYEDKAEAIGKLVSAQVEQAPAGFTQLLQAVDFALGPSHEVVIAGEAGLKDTRKLLKALNGSFIPNKIVVLNEPDDEIIQKLAPYTGDQTMQNNKATAYVCQNYSCNLPVNDAKKMLEMLSSDDSEA